MARFGIIGAGVAGLAAAWDLRRAGHEVTIFEAEGQVGGLAAGFKDDGWDWWLEKFYHHWFQSDADLLAFAEELGLREKIIFPRPKTSIWAKGKIHQLDSATSALKLPILSWPAKIRFGFVTLYLRLTNNWQWMERHTADEWLRRYAGSEAHSEIYQPLLIGKFGAFYKEANMAWMWARLHSRTPRLGTYQGGFQAFLEDTAAALRAKGIEIRLNSPVKGIKPQPDGGFLIETGTGEERFDAVISTTSPGLLLRLAPDISGAYADKVRGLRSMGAVVVVLALKHQLLTDQTYWLSLPATTPDKSRNELPYLALVEHTNYVDKANFNGDHLIYIGDYVPADHAYFKMSEDELAEKFIATLTTFNPAFSPDWIRRRWVFRAPYAQPLPTVNHSQNIPDLRTPLSGLYWASMSQVYPWDRGTNYAVEIGRRVARLALEDLP